MTPVSRPLRVFLGAFGDPGHAFPETTDMQLGVYWTRMLKLVFSGIAPIHAWWERALHAVQAGKIDPLPIISHTLPLAQAPEGYRMFEAREATKVVLKP